MSGYFAIPRDLYESIKIEHGLKGYQLTVAVLCELAARVRYNGNVGGNLEIGQCFIGKTEVATLLETTRERIRGALKVLKTLHTITTTETQRGTTVTILDKRIFSFNDKTLLHSPDNRSTLTDQDQDQDKKKKKKEANASPPSLHEVLERYSSKYHPDFLTQQYELCKEYHYAKSGKDISMLNMSYWLRNEFGQKNWEKFQLAKGLKQDPFTAQMLQWEAEMKAKNGE